MNVSHKVGDDSENVKENRRRFLSALQIDESMLAIPRQDHGTSVVAVRAPGIWESTDALITATRNVYLSVTVADCVPIFLFDRINNAVAAIHAGWRGCADGIVTKAIETMSKEFHTNPAELVAFIGPSARACCYMVGEDVAGRFDDAFICRKSGDLIFLDLVGQSQSILTAMGVPSANIEVHPQCTICNPVHFHSYRRDRKRSGRMMGVIGLVDD